MINPWKEVYYRLKRFHTMQRIGAGFARAAAVRAMQPIDPSDPATWEVSGLSQNGEDGITDFLTRQVRDPNRYFVEIGASDGTENNSSWLAVARRWRGLMVEGDPAKADYCKFLMGGLAVGVEVENRFVTRESIAELYGRFETPNPDFFSLDIDGIDWHIASALLDLGFRPKIFVVEYNSCFGPERAITIPYRPDFNFQIAHPTNLYYGVSIRAWRKLLESHGYRFVTVETNGVNAFFVLPEFFKHTLFVGLKSREFEDNFYQRTRHAGSWQKQFPLIEHLPFVDVAGVSP
ncbi:MAG: hypothetical protein AABZ15_12980 [Nitrospirota bacterium]